MYWISVKTDINDNYDYMACSRSARLSYHELVLLMARKEVTALTMGNKQIAVALGLSIQETEADLLELIEANLIERDADGQITIPAITEQVEKFSQKRTATKERVDNWREQKNASNKNTRNTDVAPLDDSRNADVTRLDDTCNAGVTRYNDVTNAQVKVKVKVKEEVKVKVNDDDDGDFQKKSQSEKPAAAPESEFVKLWREWTLHKAQIAPTFKARIDEAVTDLEVWRETLTFGARNRKIVHTNAGLDWALANYRTGLAQKRAAATPTSKPFVAAAMPKNKVFIEGVEVYVN